MARKLQLRRDTSSRWTSANPTLAEGEPGFETDTGFIKVGDGVTAWNSLAYWRGGGAAAALGSTAAAANKMAYFTSASAAATIDTTSYGRSLLNAANASALQTLASLVPGTNVQAYVAPQSQATWEAGVGTTESTVSPAKIAAAIAALVSVPDAVPAGVMAPYAGSTAPSGWLMCYGQAVSRTTYATLFAAISTTYGVGDGSTTFNLPDARGRAVAGKDDMGGVSANRLTSPINGDTLGAAGGAEANSYSYTAFPAGFTGVGASTRIALTTTADNTVASSMSIAAVQPTIILNYIIKA